VQYRFTYRRVNISDLVITRALIPLLSQPERVGQISVTFIQDRRDDPINSHTGMYNTVDVGMALKQLGSQTVFTRLLMRNSTYYRLSRDVVLARTLQFGWIERLAGSPEIPLAERFFAGGASSDRAFPDNQAGPRDLTTGFPLGGNALLMHSTELRFPLIGDNLGGVLFHDMGNVFSSVTAINARFSQHGLQDFDYMVHGIGFGIRYRTPIGPLRADFSLSPNSPRFFGFQGTFDQLLAGQGQAVNQRISIFQFHFSLGQTF
jgi:outer membrane protein assembly factor BamA